MVSIFTHLMIVISFAQNCDFNEQTSLPIYLPIYIINTHLLCKQNVYSIFWGWVNYKTWIFLQMYSILDLMSGHSKPCIVLVYNVFCQLDIEYTHLDCWYFCISLSSRYLCLMKRQKTNLVKRVQEMSVCYFSKSIIGVWYKLRSYSKVVLIISWDTPLSSNWEVGKWKVIKVKNVVKLNLKFSP